MNGKYAAVMGNRGSWWYRQRSGINTDPKRYHPDLHGVTVGTGPYRQEDLLARIQAGLKGANLVEELLIERRREASTEDAG